MDLSNRHYSKQSHMLVNAKYALTKNEIDLILTLLTEIKEDDKDFQDYVFTLKDLEFKSSNKWHSKQVKRYCKRFDEQALLRFQRILINGRSINWVSLLPIWIMAG